MTTTQPTTESKTMKNPYKCDHEGCRRNALVLFKDDKNDADTWLVNRCQNCGETYCKKHLDPNDETETCDICFEAKMHNGVTVYDAPGMIKHYLNATATPEAKQALDAHNQATIIQ